MVCSGSTEHLPVQGAAFGDSDVLFHALKLGARSDHREVVFLMPKRSCGIRRQPPRPRRAMTGCPGDGTWEPDAR